jgi:uncharacterized protein YheU (UPF0270 family)
MGRDKLSEKPLEIAPEQLSEGALSSLIESFVLREGTDYGFQEVTLEKKVLQVRRQLDRKEIKIIFDQTSETVSLVTVQDFKRRIYYNAEE